MVSQRADEPGSLISILQEFAARRINLSNLISRPTKTAGSAATASSSYADGHVDDELLADAMRALHAKQGGVKFFGSYPAAGADAETARVHTDGRWREADAWLAGIRDLIVDLNPPVQPGIRCQKCAVDCRTLLTRTGRG